MVRADLSRGFCDRSFSFGNVSLEFIKRRILQCLRNLSARRQGSYIGPLNVELIDRTFQTKEIGPDLCQVIGERMKLVAFRVELTAACPNQTDFLLISRKLRLSVREFLAETGKLGVVPIRILLRRRDLHVCLLYTSPSPRDRQKSRMP